MKNKNAIFQMQKMHFQKIQISKNEFFQNARILFTGKPLAPFFIFM